MACETGTWASVLPQNADPDDGTIIIESVNGGKIKGKHRKKDAKPGEQDELEMGECENDHIKFNHTEFHYEGDIFGRIIIGTRNVKAERELDGEEVWVGVKTA
jgi:hypothetical protein